MEENQKWVGIILDVIKEKEEAKEPLQSKTNETRNSS